MTEKALNDQMRPAIGGGPLFLPLSLRGGEKPLGSSPPLPSHILVVLRRAMPIQEPPGVDPRVPFRRCAPAVRLGSKGSVKMNETNAF